MGAEPPPWPQTLCPHASVRWTLTSLMRTNSWTSGGGGEGSGSGRRARPGPSEVDGFLRQGDMLRVSQALSCQHRDSPVNTRNRAAQERAQGVVLKVFPNFGSSESERAAQSRDRSGIDLLMKDIHKGFEKRSENSSAVLPRWWREQALALGGLGSLIRLLTARET